MKVTLIAVVGSGMELGRGGRLLWHLPADLSHFKETTMGGTVVMGRKTWESIGRALPGRTNIVISRRADLPLPDGVILKGSLRDAVAASSDNCFIIGGGEIFREAIGIADELNLTMVDDSPADADTFFPAIDPAVWQEVPGVDTRTDEKSGLTFRFKIFTRK